MEQCFPLIREFGAPGHSSLAISAQPELGRRAEHSPHTPLGRNKGKGEKGEQRHPEGPISVG